MRLIDADTLKYDWRQDRNGNMRPVNVLKAVNNAPTVDAQPVVHAHWVHVQHDWYTVVRKCSYCGTTTEMRPWNTLEECPHCGAKMDEKVNGDGD